jgi:hypothetical protein
LTHLAFIIGVGFLSALHISASCVRCQYYFHKNKNRQDLQSLHGKGAALAAVLAEIRLFRVWTLNPRQPYHIKREFRGNVGLCETAYLGMRTVTFRDAKLHFLGSGKIRNVTFEHAKYHF